ncbi:MAG: site-2 protease family protein [Candidatus Azambacteria bacterium]|nr:site-2 protease family protein [Candidatus Azambacteria bacterium]
MLNQVIFLYIIIVISAVFHEYAHGFVAYCLGDSTAKDAGRLTLNPLVHMDLFGTVILPLFLLFTGGIFIGYAKPVPYNPSNLSDKKYGSLKVAIAGPLSNLFIALIFGLFLRFFSDSILTSNIIPPVFLSLITLIVIINIALTLFNMIPFPPLDGSKVFFDLFPRYWSRVMNLGFLGLILALLVAFFLLPKLISLIFWVITGQPLGF